MNQASQNLPAFFRPLVGKAARTGQIGTGLVIGLVLIPLVCAIAFFVICNRR